ncbi:integrase core domain-containing protein [Dokdonella sp.]|uniref:integrase core domain-containing protein n=1 Tax=Dokdonella sp. TaxID=2291710 RepID=UPI0039C89EA6
MCHLFRGSLGRPGSPHQNATSNTTVELFTTIAAQRLSESIGQLQLSEARWLWIYNHERPTTAIGGITPMQKQVAIGPWLHF